MAGLSGKQIIVDVVAAAEQLRPSAVPEPPTKQAPRLEPAPPVQTEIGWSCALRHGNAFDARFCATCGLPASAAAPAVAVQSQASRPRPAAELSEGERAERERQHAAAVAAAAQFERAQPSYQPSEGEAILIHFVADGLTAFGQVWYRGQELQIGPDHPRWQEALGWITLDRWGQIERWGQHKFDFGPWPGRRSYTEAVGSFEQLTVTDGQGNKVKYSGPNADELARADEAEQRRGRAVPAPAFR